jgi:hypothetical protein
MMLEPASFSTAFPAPSTLAMAATTSAELAYPTRLVKGLQQPVWELWAVGCLPTAPIPKHRRPLTSLVEQAVLTDDAAARVRLSGTYSLASSMLHRDTKVCC